MGRSFRPTDGAGVTGTVLILVYLVTLSLKCRLTDLCDVQC